MAVKIASSKHLRTSTELTLVAPIKAKFARTQTHDNVAYATRLGALLKTLFELRRASIEKTVDGSVGPLERLRTLYNFSWSVFDGGSKLLLAVTFDRPWEPYIRAIVDQAGPFLDAIFCHCEGYDECSTEHGYVKFAEWVRARQIDVSLFYAAEPDLTVDDQRYLREFERLYRTQPTPPRFADAVARLALGEPGADGIPPRLAAPAGPEGLARFERFVGLRLGRSSAAIAPLRGLFHVHDPKDAEQVSARRFFDRAAWMVLEPIVVTPDAINRLPSHLGTMLSEMKATAEAAKAAGAKVPPLVAAAAAMAPAAEAQLEQDVQANILSSYPRMTHGCLLLIGFDSGDSARAFVGRMAQRVTAHAEVKSAELGVNVALSFEGFRTLGLTDVELERFPIEFREGMAARAGSLGDVAEEHPDRWAGPTRGALDSRVDGPLLPLSNVDLVLTVQSNEGESSEAEWGTGHPLYDRVKKLVGDDPGTRVLSVQALQREFMPRGSSANAAESGFVKERFGFADGLSQPVVTFGANEPSNPDGVALGELLLGHAGDRGEPGGYPSGPEAYTKNGSFLVVRKLEQDVEAFEEFIHQHASQFSGGADALYEKIMGRRRDGGSPISGSASNDFDYSKDAAGELCPLASHVRRANPRTPPGKSMHGLPLRGPRLARRGFSYGPFSAPFNSRVAASAEVPGPARPTATVSRGLLFMAYNASLAEQFEVIQRWLNGANSTGVLSAHADPLVSHRAGQVIPLRDGSEPRYLVKKKPFVKLVWGHYFFAPSKTGLSALAALGSTRAERARAAASFRARQGEEIIQKLLALAAVEAQTPASRFEKSIFQWKVLFEDRASRVEARAVWTAVRELHQGALRTPYGVLVGDAAGVRRVLGDEKFFSVRVYASRMRATIGLLHLGMDRCPVGGAAAAPSACPMGSGKAVSSTLVGSTPSERPSADYAAAAALPNASMHRLARGESFARAREAARSHYAELEPYVDLGEFAKRVVTEVCKSWFGLPRHRPGYDTFHASALNIFFPKPDAVVQQAARDLAQGLTEAKAAARADNPPLARELASEGWSSDQIETALVGGAQGTLAATVGSFLNVAGYCLDGDRLGRLGAWLSSPAGQHWKAEFATDGASADDGPIVREVLSAMWGQPTPDLLHRVVVAETRVGGVELSPGDTVVVSLGSAIASTSVPSERWDLLFGGAYPSEGEQPKHPCPGGRAAFGVIVGMLVALLESNARPDGALRVTSGPRG